MAIVKFINGKNKEIAGLMRLIDYVLNENKTEVFDIEHEDSESIFIEKLLEENKGHSALKYITKDNKTSAHLITGINCSSDPNIAFNEMMLTKRLHNKTDGRQFVHFVHSYSSKETDLTPEMAHEISLKLIDMERFKGFQVLVATHVDKDHIHTHFILNTVNEETGRKWQQSRKELEDLKRRSNQLCKEYGLKYSFAKLRNENAKIKKIKSLSTGEYRARKKGQSWKTEAFYAINDCRKTAVSKEDFISKLESLGYKVRWEDSRKNITFILPNGRKLNNDKLYPPENFTKEALLKKFELNRQYQLMNQNISLQEQFNARQELVLQTIKMLEENPHEGHKDYPRTYIESKQAKKELMIEKAKGEGLDWER